MKIIDKYIIKKFLGTFFFILLVIMSLACVFDYAEKLEDFIEKNRHDGLEYLVVDEETRLFSDLRHEPQEYPYLDKVFDSDDYDFINHFRIYKINYTVFDKND